MTVCLGGVELMTQSSLNKVSLCASPDVCKQTVSEHQCARGSRLFAQVQRTWGEFLSQRLTVFTTSQLHLEIYLNGWRTSFHV